MMNLTDVKKYLINYFGKNLFDYNKYDNSNVDNNLPYILSSSCTTSDIKLDLSAETYIDETGAVCKKYEDGTELCQKECLSDTSYAYDSNSYASDVSNISTVKSIIKLPDGTEETEYCDGSIKTCNPFEYKIF